MLTAGWPRMHLVCTCYSRSYAMPGRHRHTDSPEAAATPQQRDLADETRKAARLQLRHLAIVSKASLCCSHAPRQFTYDLHFSSPKKVSNSEALSMLCDLSVDHE